jgi:hypothetical protein
MINRSELVTAALLGTDRRPPNFLGEPGEHEPATVLLDDAARSAVALRAGVILPRVPPAPSGPLDPLIMAPAAAQSIMGRLLARPVIELINVWLGSAATRGVGLEPALWSAVILLAARRPDLDRPLLAQVLGPRGLWFCEQNPEWQRLASALRRARTGPPAVPVPAEPPSVRQPIVGSDEGEQDPELDPIAQLRLEIHQAFADHDHQEPLP